MKGWMRAGSIAIMLTGLAMSPVLLGADQGNPTGTKPKPGATTSSQDKPAAAGASADAAFMRRAAGDNMAEVELGQLAAKNAASSDVKQFGQRMVDDHSKANDELKGLASKKSVSLPAAVDAKHKAVHDKLAKLQGAAFDSAYMSQMVSGHKEDVALFQREAKTGKDPDAKAWAEKTLPTLQEHLKMAQDIHAKAGKSGSKPPKAETKKD